MEIRREDRFPEIVQDTKENLEKLQEELKEDPNVISTEIYKDLPLIKKPSYKLSKNQKKRRRKKLRKS